MRLNFGDKLVDNTCIFCGAPLSNDDRCNYCGSYYINYNKFKKLSLVSNLEIDINYLDTSTEEPMYLLYAGNRIFKSVLFPNSIIDSEFRCSSLYKNSLYNWLNSQADSNGYMNRNKIELKLNLNKTQILYKGCLLRSMKTSYNSSESELISCNIIADEYFVLKN